MSSSLDFDSFTTVTLHNTQIVVTVERTGCPQLGIGPVVSLREGITNRLALIHLPTGTYLPPSLSMILGGRDGLRKMADEIADLDWDFHEPHDAPLATAEGYLAARRAGEFSSGEQIFTEYPENWGQGEDALPGDADSMLRWLLDGWQFTYEVMHNRDHPNKISMNNPDGSMNPEWVAASFRLVDMFGMAYLLAALRRVSPDVADHVTAFLAVQWSAGDSLGEWVWQWRDELKRDAPMTLPAVPSPAPADGELFAPTRFVKFKEQNDHEGETWCFWIPLTGNETTLAGLDAALGDTDEYGLDLARPVPERDVDVLVEHSSVEEGYMPAHNKLAGVLSPGLLSLGGSEAVADALYKGGIKDYMTGGDR